MNSATPRRKPLERLEELAEKMHGRGAAVSVDYDRKARAVIVRVWNPKGVEVKKASRPTRDEACRALLEELAFTNYDRTIA